MTFYRTKDCPGCQAIEDTLNDLAIAYDCVAVEDGNELPGELVGQKLPILIDEGKTIRGSSNIIDHLADLANLKKQWYKYQSDACYCEDD